MLYKVYLKIDGYDILEWVEAGDAEEARDKAARMHARGRKKALIEVEKIEVVKIRS